MKSLKYLNCVLTVIAVCLTILTISVIGAFPKANASANSDNFVNSPLKKDRATNAQPPVTDLIFFNRGDGPGRVYISKATVICIKDLNGAQSEIYLTGGAVVKVNGVASNIAQQVR